jgi:hypothetical protein
MRAVAAWLVLRGVERVQASAHEVRAMCPFHAGDIPTLAVYESGRFVCWSARCAARGTWQQLADRVGGTPPDRRALVPRQEMVVYPEAYLHGYPYAYRELARRGIGARVAHAFNVRWDIRPERGALLLPSHSSSGQMVGVTWRYPDDRRYRHHRGFPRGRLCYGLHLLRGRTMAVVTEGFFDTLRLVQFGIPALSTYGASLTEDQVTELVTAGIDCLVFMYDNDLAGFTGAFRAWDLAHNKVDIHFAMGYKGAWPKDPGESDWTTVRRLLNHPVDLGTLWREATERWAECHEMWRLRSRGPS